MLPESKGYLKKDGWDDSRAGLIMMASFISGFVGIQVISRLLHQVMPSHVVDCDHSHSHDHTDGDHKHCRFETRQPSRVGRPLLRSSSSGRRMTTVTQVHTNGHAHRGLASESTPLLGSHANGRPVADAQHRDVSALGVGRRPSMKAMRDRLVSFVQDKKATCDEEGSCFGYSDPCGQECFKHVASRPSVTRQDSFGRSQVRDSFFRQSAPAFDPVPEVNSEGNSGAQSPMSPGPAPAGLLRTSSTVQTREPLHHHHHHQQQQNWPHDHEDAVEEADCDQVSDYGVDAEAQDDAHHHHVPANPFLDIGLQTIIAIALHKFPEGFITYATNHANPRLGFNVFMALFVHNIAEGFLMALPLYMALKSRAKAIAWTVLLGGFSQPAGAAIAWSLFKVVGNNSGEAVGIDYTAYAVLFAVTAGIMASVALQLFVESLSLNHNRNLGMAFAFLGMVLMGVSSAIAGHSH